MHRVFVSFSYLLLCLTRPVFLDTQTLQHASILSKTMSRQEEQAGLEVINYPTHSSPGNASFSTHSPSPGYLHPPQEYGEKIPVHEDQQLGSSATHKSTDPRANRKRRPLWMVIAVIGVVLVVVAAVVGGVVGSKSKKHHESTEGHGTEQSTLIRNKSSLAVTGWRSEGNSNIQLFWQGKDDFVYYSAWHSEQQSWNKPTKLSIGASPGTPMAASIIFLNPLESVSIPEASLGGDFSHVD